MLMIIANGRGTSSSFEQQNTDDEKKKKKKKDSYGSYAALSHQD